MAAHDRYVQESRGGSPVELDDDVVAVLDHATEERVHTSQREDVLVPAVVAIARDVARCASGQRCGNFAGKIFAMNSSSCRRHVLIF